VILRLSALACAVFLLGAATPTKPASKPDAGAPKAAADDDLPKPAPRGPDKDKIAKLPPFMGIFGTAPLIAKTGFRSTVGRYVEFKAEGTLQQAELLQGTGLRIQEVGPAVAGSRWIEILPVGVGGEQTGVRVLCRGEGNGNIERLIAAIPTMPAIEFPVEAATMDGMPGLPGGAPSLTAEPKLVARETITVPLGRFETEHWAVGEDKGRIEIWVTKDPLVPFTGAIKIVSAEGGMVAHKVGTDAKPRIPVPARRIDQ